MVFDVRITGADQVREVGRLMRAAGEEGKGLRTELRAEIKALEAPMIHAVRASAEANLPKAGRANEYFAASKIKSRIRFAGKLVGTSIYSKRGGATKGSETTDDGSLRHPVFGNQKVWAETKIEPGWFSKPLKAMAPAVQLALWRSIQTTINKIGR